MIVKWIRAAAAPAFGDAQRGWARIAGSPGLRGQGGGWSLNAPGRAVVVAGWADRAAHDAFLAGDHDEIAAAQRATYTAIAVDILDVQIGTVPSELGAGVLRTAACRLRPGRLDHALAVQRELWLPAMRDAGMRDGLLATDEGHELLLVMTWWPSRETHDRYQRERVAALRQEADVTADFSAVDGDLVALEPSWTVPGESR